MSMAVDRRRAGSLVAAATPNALLAAVLVGLAALLMLPVSVPIGPMYWDLFIYFDAAQRIFDGQVPVIDFFTPVGPLGYYLFALGLALFPDAQPLLLVHWSLLAVTAPAMALVMHALARDGRQGTALALLVPFLVFAVLPFNTREFYPYPGSDGFGIYNRQVCQLLYVLVAALVFVRGQRLLAALVAVLMAALFFTKVTGFVSGLVLCGFAFLAGRIAFGWAAAAAAAFLALLAGLELSAGLVSHYVGDILALVAMNSGSLAPRFLQAASHTFGIVAAAGLLMLMLLYGERRTLAADLAALARRPRPAALARLVDRPALWIGVVLFAGILFETQNTGSQALIFLWPVLLPVLAGLPRPAGPRTAAVAVLIAAAALPPLVNTVEKAARTYAGALKTVPLPGDNLKTLGRVSVRPEMLQRAERMRGFYAEHRATYEALIETGALPAFLLYSDFDFQALHLMTIDAAVARIRALEAETGARAETVLALNFVNPFPWLLARSAPRHVAIGADPMRAVPDPGADELAAVGATDLVLHPTCPVTTANAALRRLYAPALADHTTIALTPCYDAYVHPRLAGALTGAARQHTAASPTEGLRLVSDQPDM